MSMTIKICNNTIIIKNKAFSSLKVTYLSIREYPNLKHRCPFKSLKVSMMNRVSFIRIKGADLKTFLRKCTWKVRIEGSRIDAIKLN